MKKLLIVALGVAALATFGTTLAFAQAWYGATGGTSNIVPDISSPPTPDNPNREFRFKFQNEMGMTERTERFGTMNETGLSSFAQAPAPIPQKAKHHRAHRPMEVAPSAR
ncbi:MAG: hypothetical protein ACHP82_01255 [Hyphomicrobiales bacterium]